MAFAHTCYNTFISPQGKPYTVHRVLLGTHTSGQSQDYLQIAEVHLPKRSGPNSDVLDRSSYDDESGELGGHTLPAHQKRVQVTQRINHDGEVNRARYMPQNPDLIATKTVSGEVYVFDRTRHSSEPERGGVCKPDIRLVGQAKEGCVLLRSWRCGADGNTQVWPCVESSQQRQHSCRIRRHDRVPLVCHRVQSCQARLLTPNRDVNANYSKSKTRIEPTNIFRGHSSIVGVCAFGWSSTHGTLTNTICS